MFDYIKRQHGLSSSRYPKRRTQKLWFRLQPANCSLYIKCVKKERNWSLCWSASVFVSLTISHSSQTKTHQPNSTIAVSRKYEPETECGWDDAAFKAKTYFWISCGCVFSLYFAVSEAGQSIISAGAAAVSHLKRKSAQAQRPWSPVYSLPDEFHRPHGISARAISFWRVYSCFQYFSWAVVLLLCFPTWPPLWSALHSTCLQAAAPPHNPNSPVDSCASSLC